MSTIETHAPGRGRNWVSIIASLAVLVAAYMVVHWVVITKRAPGAMTVVEAQAMDMSASGTPVGAAPVAVETVEPRMFAPGVTYSGTVVALNDEEIYPRVTGALVALFVYPGDTVRPGQLVGKLDSAELSSKVVEAAAARDAAQHDMAISGEEYRQAEAQERAAKAKAAGAGGGLRDAQAQVTAAQAMQDQAEREQEAAQAEIEDARANITAMRADADYWSKEIAREQKLFASGAVSREELERERSQAQGAQAKVTQANSALRERQAMLAAAKAKARQAAASLASAQAKVAQARSDVEAAQADASAWSANANMNIHHQEHRAALADMAVAQERTAKIVRGYTELRAAGGGTVTERLVSPGTLVQPGMAILKVKDLSSVRLQAAVAETDLGGIHVGTSVSVSGLNQGARVTSIFNSASAQSRTVTVEALVSNPGHKLLPGQYVVMQFAKGMPLRSLTVPTGAIGRDESQRAFVWTVVENKQTGKTVYTCVMHPEVKSDKPGKCPKCGMDLVPEKRGGKLAAHRTFVMLGASDGKRSAVTDGLREGDRVVTRGGDNLKEGDAVAPSEWGPSGPKALPQPSGGEMQGMPGMPGMKSDAPGLGSSSHDLPVASVTPAHRMTLAPVMAPMAKDKPVYTCPMHPDVKSTKPGKCPKCGMKLVKVEKTPAVVYTCPMHPEVRSTKPGKCPKCGMKLVKVEKTPAVVYTCPMHPEVKSNKPGKCPKCGMKLVPKKAGKS